MQPIKGERTSKKGMRESAARAGRVELGGEKAGVGGGVVGGGGGEKGGG